MSLSDMVLSLHAQQAAKVDIVAPSTAFRSRDGAIELSGAEPVVDENGVTDVNGLYLPTRDADTAIATKLGIGVKYLQRLRAERLDLYDANVNGLLHGLSRCDAGGSTLVYPPDDRSFLLRLFCSSAVGERGVMRTMLSDRYGIIDNLDVLSAVLDGVRQADVEVEIRTCDLTESTMHCKVWSPGVARLAPHFLANYRSPFANPELEAQRREISTTADRLRQLSGNGAYTPGEEPIVFAGFRISNSEVGAGAFTLTPELVVQICSNGLTLPMLRLRKLHQGARMDHGAVTWSQDTLNKHLAVITAQTRDAVREWLSPTFLAEQLDGIEQQAGVPVIEPQKMIKVLGRNKGFSQAEQDGILSHFIAGGQLTAAGIANAITSYSQTVADPARADALDDTALASMALA